MDILTGQIQFGINNIYDVKSDGKIYQCRIKGKILKQDEKYYNPLTPGDIVDFEPDPLSDKHGSIIALHERKAVFSRWNRKRMSIQLLAANFDILFLISSADEPPFRPRFADRVLLSENETYQKIILFNKTDLKIKKETEERLADYEKIGYSVIRCSAETGKGIDILKETVKGKLCAFVGQSGVGKSSIINLLTGEETQKTGEISRKYRRGRHTTNYSVIIPYRGGQIIDTPGIRDMFISKVETEKLGNMFVDFKQFIPLCEYKGCSHINETGCGVKQAVSDGKIYYDRYVTYEKLYDEMTINSEEIYGSPYN